MQRRILLLLVGLLAVAATALAGTASAAPTSPGAVYTLTNSPAGNAVLAYHRAADGTLGAAGTYATGGTGTGGGLGSQGALALSGNGRRLFAVNPGSNSVTEFRVAHDRLEWVATVPSGGSTPISLTYRHHVLYVLNAGAGGNISGFEVRGRNLTPLSGSTQPLGAGSAGPAQVSFTPDGHTLVVTEKASSTIDTYGLDRHGVAGAPVTAASAGSTPFGFDFAGGRLLVSEAGGSASSYSVGPGGVGVISGAVPTHQAAPCWLVATRDGRYAYTANGGSGTISGFSVSTGGVLSLLDPSGVSANIGAGSHPLDETISRGGRFLYNLTDGLHRISGFRIGDDGSLSAVDSIGGLPAGAAGIVAS